MKHGSRRKHILSSVKGKETSKPIFANSEETVLMRGLAPLESFDPAAFLPDDNVSPQVCRFALSLSLIFNDLSDLLRLGEFLNTQEPAGSFEVSQRWGAYCGINAHHIRLLIGLVHEAISVVRDNANSIDDPFFQSVVTRLSKKQRESWNSFLHAAVDGKQTNNPLGKFIFFVRNKVAFHYDAKEIQSAYRDFFSHREEAGADRAYISRGCDISSTRYYFADAAARWYLVKDSDGEHDRLILEAISTLADLDSAIMAIINHFIQRRGFAYRSEHEGV